MPVALLPPVRQVLRLPGTDNIRVVVEGRYRAGLIELTQDDPFLCGIVREKRTVRAKSGGRLISNRIGAPHQGSVRRLRGSSA